MAANRKEWQPPQQEPWWLLARKGSTERRSALLARQMSQRQAENSDRDEAQSVNEAVTGKEC